jgi:hypothetical protein
MKHYHHHLAWANGQKPSQGFARLLTVLWVVQELQAVAIVHSPYNEKLHCPKPFADR